MVKRWFFSFVIVACLSACGGTTQDMAILNLEDYKVGEMVLHKPAKIHSIRVTKILEQDGKKYAVSESINAYDLYAFESGLRTFSYRIPLEGPEAMKGGMNGSAVISPGEFILFNQSGYFHQYLDGKLNHAQQVPLNEILNNRFTQISKQSGNLIKTSTGSYQVILNPFDFMNSNGGYDPDFRSWLLEIDREQGVGCVADFKAPFDEAFKDSQTVTLTNGVYNPNRDEYWLQFALSDSIYQFKSCQIVQKKLLNSIENHTYLPDLVQKQGRNTRWNPNPKSHKNIHLLYDEKSRHYLRLVQLPQSISEEDILVMDLRETSKIPKDYQLLVYDENWQLLKVFQFSVSGGGSLESVFVDNGLLYLNQFEQESEDEYVLISYDLNKM